MLLIAILGIVLFLVWSRFPDYKSFSQGDPYLDANQYITGKNFGERGFITEKFLPDYATGPEECYPLWYTHNPAFSEILSGIYYRFGLHDISHHRPIAILWNMLGAWFFYVLLKRLVSPRAALFSLAVLISNPLYIAWGDNLNIHHQWCFIFAGMYFFLRSADAAKSQENGNIYDDRSAGLLEDPERSRRESCLPRAGLKPCTTKDAEPGNSTKSPSFTSRLSGLKTPPTAGLPGSRNTNLYLGLAALCFFLLCYSNYEYVPFVAIFFIGVKLFKIRRISWARAVLPLGAGLAAFVIHQLCVIWAVGLNYWLLDKTESLLHRTGIGVTPLMEIYKKIPLLMWEEQARLQGSFTLPTYWKGFYLHLENLFGIGWSVLLVGVCLLPGLFLPGERRERKSLFRIILLFFIMSNFWFVAFVQHTADHQWGSTILLFAPFAALLYGSALTGIYENLIRRERAATDGSRRVILINRIIGIIIIIILLGGLIGGRIRTSRPFKAYPGIAALQKHRGAHFLTTSIPTLVSACTGTPTGWMSGKHPAQMYFRARYLVNPGCAITFEPDFFFSPRHPESPDFARPFDTWLSANFKIEEQGENFAIYNLKKPLNPSGPVLVDRQRLTEIRNKLPRAIGARLKEDKKPCRYHRPPGAGKKNGVAKRIARKILEVTGAAPSLKSESPPELLLVQPASDNLFSPSHRLDASSTIGEVRGIDNLCDQKPGRYWHVALDKAGEPAWVMIDFGEGREEIVNFIRTGPRPDIPKQSFKDAVIQGSRNGANWEDIAAIIEEEVPARDDWRGWFFRNSTPYRFYRLFIIDGHEENGAFYSLGALELYRVIKEGS